MQRSHFLRGWLSEEETRELLAQCCEDDISLQGIYNILQYFINKCDHDLNLCVLMLSFCNLEKSFISRFGSGCMSGCHSSGCLSPLSSLHPPRLRGDQPEAAPEPRPPARRPLRPPRGQLEAGAGRGQGAAVGPGPRPHQPPHTGQGGKAGPQVIIQKLLKWRKHKW